MFLPEREAQTGKIDQGDSSGEDYQTAASPSPVQYPMATGDLTLCQTSDVPGAACGAVGLGVRTASSRRCTPSSRLEGDFATCPTVSLF